MILIGSLYVGKVDNMEVRFSMAKARGPSLRLGFLLLLSLSALGPLEPGLPGYLPSHGTELVNIANRMATARQTGMLLECLQF